MTGGRTLTNIFRCEHRPTGCMRRNERMRTSIERIHPPQMLAGPATTYLLPMHLALCCEQSLVPCSHTRERVTHKVRLRVFVAAAHDVVHRERVDGHEPAAADETAIDEGGAVLGRPAGDEPVVLLVMHVPEVAHEERGRGRAGEVPERRARLAEDGHGERPEEVERNRRGCEEHDEEG